MKKLLFFITTTLLLCGCMQTRDFKKTEIYEDPKFVANFNQKIANLNANEIAKYQVSEFSKKIGGAKNRFKINEFIIFEEIFADKNFAVFNYSLTTLWASGSVEQRQNAMKNIQVDLLNLACNQQTTRNALKKGYGELHRYFYDYPQNLTFAVQIDEANCQKAGL